MGEMGFHDVKLFTVDEANSLIPKFVTIFKDLYALRDTIAGQEVEIDALELIDNHTDGKRSKILDEKLDVYNETIARFYNKLDEIQNTGALIKDVNAGLVDFHSLQESKVVHLCWRLGEDSIRFWHDVGKGFTDRRPLNPDQSSL